MNFSKSEAFVASKSMAAVLRNLLDEIIQSRQQDLLANDPIWEVIGVAESVDAPADISENVDKYLYGEAAAAETYYALPNVAEGTDEYTTD